MDARATGNHIQSPVPSTTRAAAGSPPWAWSHKGHPQQPNTDLPHHRWATAFISVAHAHTEHVPPGQLPNRQSQQGISRATVARGPPKCQHDPTAAPAVRAHAHFPTRLGQEGSALGAARATSPSRRTGPCPRRAWRLPCGPKPQGHRPKRPGPGGQALGPTQMPSRGQSWKSSNLWAHYSAHTQK